MVPIYVWRKFHWNSKQILIYWLILRVGKGSKDKENRPFFICTLYISDTWFICIIKFANKCVKYVYKWRSWVSKWLRSYGCQMAEMKFSKSSATYFKTFIFFNYPVLSDRNMIQLVNLAMCTHFMGSSM